MLTVPPVLDGLAVTLRPLRADDADEDVSVCGVGYWIGRDMGGRRFAAADDARLWSLSAPDARAGDAQGVRVVGATGFEPVTSRV